jgi:hypothetical protein
VAAVLALMISSECSEADDANVILGVKTSMSFEDFEQAVRSTINGYE